MHRRTRTKAWLRRTTVAAAWAASTLAGQAQPVTDPATNALTAPHGLRQAFDAAWARQPEALALQARRDAARAQQRAAQAWTPEPMALEAFNRTDRLNDKQSFGAIAKLASGCCRRASRTVRPSLKRKF